MVANPRNLNGIIHLELNIYDDVKPCPFCGGTEITLENTHTASYWIACTCGAEVHGKAYGTNTPSNKLTLRHHKLAKAAAIAAWNRRA